MYRKCFWCRKKGKRRILFTCNKQPLLLIFAYSRRLNGFTNFSSNWDWRWVPRKAWCQMYPLTLAGVCLGGLPFYQLSELRRLYTTWVYVRWSVFPLLLEPTVVSAIGSWTTEGGVGEDTHWIWGPKDHLRLTWCTPALSLISEHIQHPTILKKTRN